LRILSPRMANEAPERSSYFFESAYRLRARANYAHNTPRRLGEARENI